METNHDLESELRYEDTTRHPHIPHYVVTTKFTLNFEQLGKDLARADDDHQASFMKGFCEQVRTWEGSVTMNIQVQMLNALDKLSKEDVDLLKDMIEMVEPEDPSTHLKGTISGLDSTGTSKSVSGTISDQGDSA